MRIGFGCRFIAFLLMLATLMTALPLVAFAQEDPSAAKEEVYLKSVKLEDIIESEPSDIIVSEEAFKECNEIRFQYKNHDGLYLMLYIYGVDGDFYLDICDYVDDVENHKWHKIKPEYIALLTSAIPKAE